MESLVDLKSLRKSPLPANPWSPPVVLNEVSTGSARIFVAREDLLPGGTKQRAIAPYLLDVLAGGVNEVVYASPFCGFAQVALAYCGSILNVPVTLFCERDTSLEGSTPELHEFSKLAESCGAKIYLVETLCEAEEKSFQYGKRPGVFKIPLGFRDENYMNHMATKLKEQYSEMRRQLGREIQRIWLPVGSGTLTTIFSKVLPRDCELNCVDVRVLCPEDERIAALNNFPNLNLYRTQEQFHEKSLKSPPLPSNLHYDAKLWTFLCEHAKEGDIWWNVAR